MSWDDIGRLPPSTSESPSAWDRWVTSQDQDDSQRFRSALDVVPTCMPVSLKSARVPCSRRVLVTHLVTTRALPAACQYRPRRQCAARPRGRPCGRAILLICPPGEGRVYVYIRRLGKKIDRSRSRRSDGAPFLLNSTHATRASTARTTTVPAAMMRAAIGDVARYTRLPAPPAVAVAAQVVRNHRGTGGHASERSGTGSLLAGGDPSSMVAMVVLLTSLESAEQPWGGLLLRTGGHSASLGGARKHRGRSSRPQPRPCPHTVTSEAITAGSAG
jgi:hypothetical protein